MITLKDTVQHNSSCYIAKVVETEVASSPNTKPLDCTLYCFCETNGNLFQWEIHVKYT